MGMYSGDAQDGGLAGVMGVLEKERSVTWISMLGFEGLTLVTGGRQAMSNLPTSVEESNSLAHTRCLRSPTEGEEEEDCSW